MGLHPKGIYAVMVLAVDLLSRGYKVVVSTHSSNVLDIIWALGVIKSQHLSIEKMTALMVRLLNLKDGAGVSAMVGKIFKLQTKIYCFHQKPDDGKVHSKDISSLDPGHDDDLVSGWGEIVSFSAQVSDIVAEAVRESPKNS